MKKVIVPVIVICVLAIGIIGFLQFNKNQSATSLSPTNSNGNIDVVQYAIDMDNYSFSPNILKAEPGKNLKIKLTSKNNAHRLVTDKLNFDSGIISAGESKTVTISIPSSANGEYEFYCGVSNHKIMGMVGKLQVGNI